MKLDELKEQIFKLVGEFAERGHAAKPFMPGKSMIPVAGRVYGKEEIIALVDAALEFWLTTGRFNNAFEKRLAEFLGVRHALTVNSGSSANLLAIAALTSHQLGVSALNPGDEVITVAVAFPTTINPLLLYGLIPVFVDVDIPTYNINPEMIEAAISDKTRAIILAHTLGNPFNIEAVMRFAEKYDLWVIEDCCDALGSVYDGRKVGTFGDIATLSFYPAHHITMGEGGAVLTDSNEIKVIIQSLRDWGRDCYCEPGKDNTCGNRFQLQFGTLPKGYDHKYVYSHAGYNLKITDMQAAVGLAQLDRLTEFIKARKANFVYLRQLLQRFDRFFILPEATKNSEPSWFGFPMTICESAPFSREELLRFLYRHYVDTRLLFSGNIIRQPYFQKQQYKVSGILQMTDVIMSRAFWIGIYPGLTEDMLNYTVRCIENFLTDKGCSI